MIFSALLRAKGARYQYHTVMAGDIPSEVVMAKLSIQAALVALESLVEKLSALPRTQKALASEEVIEACQRLKSAQDLLAKLESLAARA